MNRRQFLISTSGFALAVQRVFGSDPRYKIGYTTNTRGSDPLTTWCADPFRGFREAHDVGFNYVEAFATALHEFYPNDAAGLRKRIDGIGVKSPPSPVARAAAASHSKIRCSARQ